LPTFETAIPSNITDEKWRIAGLRSTGAEIHRIAEKNEAARVRKFSILIKTLLGMLAAN
jgi:hypothetical protein